MFRIGVGVTRGSWDVHRDPFFRFNPWTNNLFLVFIGRVDLLRYLSNFSSQPNTAASDLLEKQQRVHPGGVDIVIV